MSRFWNAASSSEDEKDDVSQSSEEVQPVIKPVDRKFAAAYDESDSDSEDEVRVVKSQKDRAWDSIRDGITKIKNARRNADWPLIQDEFNNVNKMIEKAKMLIMKDGLPKFYIRMLGELEDFVQTALKDKDAVKKMKPIVSRALNQMKLQVRKHNDNYKDEIADFRAHPEKYEEEAAPASSSDDDSDSSGSDSDTEDSDSSDADSSDDDSDSGASDESVKKPTKTPPAKQPAAAPAAKSKFLSADDSSDSDDSLFGVGDDDDESSSESEEEGRQELKGRARWLKKAVTAKPVKKVVSKVPTKNVTKVVKATPLVAKQPTYIAEDKMTEEELDKKVSDLVASRGRKGIDNREMLRQLEVLTKAARLHGSRKEIPVLMHLISSMFDSQKSIDDYMDSAQWYMCYRSLTRVIYLLDQNKSLELAPMGLDELSDLTLALNKTTLTATAVDDSEKKVVNDKIIRVSGNIESFLTRLEEEYTKSLQQINPHTQEYVETLANEAALIELEEAALMYYQRIHDTKSAASIALLIIEHLYYKHTSHAIQVFQAHAFTKKYGKYVHIHPASKGKSVITATGSANEEEIYHPASYLGNPIVSIDKANMNFSKRLEDLAGYIYTYGDERNKTRALLCTVYHYALHDNYYMARDLFVISHIQEFIEKTDIKTQILYNRSIVTLGLCAFRLGLYQKAHDCLSQICSSGRVKELLAQGTVRNNNMHNDRDIEQERLERRRQIPYHMHINPDLLDCCHLTCAMILELPLLARSLTTSSSTLSAMSGCIQPSIQQGFMISKPLRKYLSSYAKQTFTGPPETIREHVLAATNAVLQGDWKKATFYLFDVEVWKLIPNEGGLKVKQLLQSRIQEEAIRCYLLLNTMNYDSISLQLLCDMFEMDAIAIRRIICHMIFEKEISASWEGHNGNILVLYKTEPSTLHTLSLHLAEKMTSMLENNERMIDSLVGGVYGYDDWKGGNTTGDAKRSGGGDRGGGGQSGDRDRGNAGVDGGYRKHRGYGNVKSNRPVVANKRNTNPAGGNKGKGGGGIGGNNQNQNGYSWGGQNKYKKSTNPTNATATM